MNGLWGQIWVNLILYYVFIRMDSFASYRAIASNPRPMTKREIEKMKKLMRRVPVIKKKNDEHHKKEVEEAENLFQKQIDSINN